ncbi:PKD domain-containing protein [Dactylosporangium sp. CA-092794]|uniref:PKD domain-containing protein n=1 Tax=Dactylosporangium sp. CA-092794 TaxID=3239929 RepID=UPI003D9351FB
MLKPLIAGLNASALGAAALIVLATPANAATAPRQVLYVSGYRSDDLGVIADPTTGKAIGTITDPATFPNSRGGLGGMAFDPVRGRVYIADNFNHRVAVVDPARARVVQAVPVGERPRGLAVAPGGGHVYVANRSAGSVTVIDAANPANTVDITLGKQPIDVAVAPDGKRAYVAIEDLNTGGNGQVAVLDLATNKVTATIPVGVGTAAIALTPDGRRAYVTNLTAGTVSVLDLTNNTVTTTITAGTQPSDVAVANDGRRAYVTNLDAGTATVVDTVTNTVAATITLPRLTHPNAITMAPDGTRAYIASSQQVIPLDLATGTTATPIEVSADGLGVTVVTIAEPVGPTAAFSYTDPTAADPRNVRFNAGESLPGTARIVRYNWDFGDGRGFASTSPEAQNYYQAPGNYTVQLTITDADGRTATNRKTVRFSYLGRTTALLAMSNLRYVTAEAGGSQPLIPNRPIVGDWERFEIVDLGGGDVAVRAQVNNRYLAVDQASKRLIANATQPVPFRYVAGADGAVSLQHKASGKYVSTNGDRQLTADRDAIGPWEKFLAARDVNHWIRAEANGRYVTAEDGGRGPLIANRTQIGSWETFDLLDAGDGWTALFSHANYTFVVAEAGGAKPLVANRTAVGPWEKFVVLINPDNATVQALYAGANNKLVTAEAGGAQPLIANRTAIGSWEQFRGLP